MSNRPRKPTVCVDLDGVLAQYDGWLGVERIGAPIQGAKEFLCDLHAIARVVIFTVRTNLTEQGDDRGLTAVRNWLERREMPYDEIYTGQGKPIASAYVDDRAVYCAPLTTPVEPVYMYQQAFKECQRLLKCHHTKDA